MNSKDPMKYLEVDINGAKELKLVVTDGGKWKWFRSCYLGRCKTSFCKL